MITMGYDQNLAKTMIKEENVGPPFTPPYCVPDFAITVMCSPKMLVKIFVSIFGFSKKKSGKIRSEIDE